jgi:glutaredoxin-like YruB-family protein
MKIIEIKAFDQLEEFLILKRSAYLLLYKGGSGLSDCALENIRNSGSGEVEILMADVNTVRDIHGRYGVNSVPSLLVFEEGRLINVIKGCHDKSYFRGIFESLIHRLAAGEGKPSKSVTVYTTPTCSWCTTLKGYLRKNHISFTEINVASDQDAAAEMVRRSGQQGVPQTLIDGQVVVGFDKARLNQLLEIQSQS